MGYIITIAEHEPKYKKDISAEINEYLENNKFYLFWNYGDGYKDLDEDYFKWSIEFLRYLHVLNNLGARGHLTC
jgi:hypothetical protein